VEPTTAAEAFVYSWFYVYPFACRVCGKRFRHWCPRHPPDGRLPAWWRVRGLLVTVLVVLIVCALLILFVAMEPKL
jgi:hypothetical protein